MDDEELPPDISRRSALIAFLESRIAELEAEREENARITKGLIDQLELLRGCPICGERRIPPGRGST